MVGYCPDCGSEIEETNRFCKSCGKSLLNENKKSESNEDAKLLKFLELERNRLQDHGNKIWDEIKHFSWVLYILLSATPLLKFSSGIDEPVFKSILIIILPVFAVIVAIIAFLSFNNESTNFDDALESSLNIEEKLGFFDENLVSESRKSKTKRSSCEKLLCTGRGYFNLYFILLILIGFLEFLLFSISEMT